jgi:hypothetical protein
LRNTPTFKVTAPAFCASASVGADGPFKMTKMFVKSMPPTIRPMIGVKMSLTKLFTTAVKATPMMMPTAKSTTLPRMTKARNSSIQAGLRTLNGTAVRSLMCIPSRLHTLNLMNFSGESVHLGRGRALSIAFYNAESCCHCPGERDAVPDPGGRYYCADTAEICRDGIGQSATGRNPVQHDQQTSTLTLSQLEGGLGRPQVER